MAEADKLQTGERRDTARKRPEYGNYTIDQLLEEGFEPVGRPGLLLGVRHKITEEHEELAVKLANPEEGFTYDAYAMYVRTEGTIGEVTRKAEAGADYWIVQPLKKIEARDIRDILAEKHPTGPDGVALVRF